VAQLVAQPIKLRSDGSVPEPLLPGALSKALCYINRLQVVSNGKLPARILCLTASAQLSAYVPFMNCVCEAQKRSIMIDSCVLESKDIPFLQQASHLTRDIYYRVSSAESFLPSLLFLFLSDSSGRPQLTFPQQATIDYRATCFCHRKFVDQAVVCQACLSSQPFHRREKERDCLCVVCVLCLF
jgi:transcription initiation factor TFIIH subunit 3